MREIAHHGNVDVFPALDGDDGLLGRSGVRLEIDKAVDTRVRTFLLAAIWNGFHERDGPPLELVLVFCCERSRSVQILRCPVYFELHARERIC